MYFDTHAHLDDAAFDEDRDELLARLMECGVDCVLDPGCDPESSRKAAALAEREDWIWFAAGIHPEELHAFTAEGLEEIAALLRHPKCRAVGEIGLDYYWDDTHKEEQKQLFHAQLSMALERDLPVVIHDREAHADSLLAVKELPGLRGVFHCYSGSVELARELWKRGWYVGFDGPLTYKNARKAVAVASEAPLDRILIETDAPYLAPAPLRGTRNDSRALVHVAAKLAALRGMTAEEIVARTAENGRRLFGVAQRL